jgi:hypothetical protein
VALQAGKFLNRRWMAGPAGNATIVLKRRISIDQGMEEIE